MKIPIFSFHTFKTRFTGIKTRVNHPAGKSLGGSCLFLSLVSPYESKGDAKSPAGLEGHYSQGNYSPEDNPQGQLRRNLSFLLMQE